MQVVPMLRGVDGCARRLPTVRLKSKTSIRKAAAAIVRSVPDPSSIAEVAIVSPSADVTNGVVVRTFAVGKRGGILAGKPKTSRAATADQFADRFNVCSSRTAESYDEEAAAAAEEAAADPDRIGREPRRQQPDLRRQPDRRQQQSTWPTATATATATAGILTNAVTSMLQRRIRDLESITASLRSDLSGCRERMTPSSLIARGVVSRQASAEEADLRKRLAAAESALATAVQQAAADKTASAAAYRQDLADRDQKLAYALKLADDQKQSAIADANAANRQAIAAARQEAAAADELVRLTKLSAESSDSELRRSKADAERNLQNCRSESADCAAKANACAADAVQRTADAERLAADVVRLGQQIDADRQRFVALQKEIDETNNRLETEKQNCDTFTSIQVAAIKQDYEAKLSDIDAAIQRQMNDAADEKRQLQAELAAAKADADDRLLQARTDYQKSLTERVMAIREPLDRLTTSLSNENRQLKANLASCQAQLQSLQPRAASRSSTETELANVRAELAALRKLYDEREIERKLMAADRQKAESTVAAITIQSDNKLKDITNKTDASIRRLRQEFDNERAAIEAKCDAVRQQDTDEFRRQLDGAIADLTDAAEQQKADDAKIAVLTADLKNQTAAVRTIDAQLQASLTKQSELDRRNKQLQHTLQLRDERIDQLQKASAMRQTAYDGMIEQQNRLTRDLTDANVRLATCTDAAAAADADAKTNLAFCETLRKNLLLETAGIRDRLRIANEKFAICNEELTKVSKAETDYLLRELRDSNTNQTASNRSGGGIVARFRPRCRIIGRDSIS